MNALELGDIQGNILRGYKMPHVAHLFGWIDAKHPENVERWRRTLSELTLTSAADWGDQKPDFTLNLGLSFTGLRALRPDLERELSSLFPAFAEGMPQRSELLGEAFPSVPWERRHVWLTVHASGRLALEQRLRQLVRQLGVDLSVLEPPGAALVKPDPSNPSKTAWYEHFGFRDDISYPVMAGTVDASEAQRATLLGRGKYEPGIGWAPIAVGEVLLGYENESEKETLAGCSEPARRLLSNGSFAVFRHLRQDVVAFRRYTSAQVSPEARTPEDVAARMMGRKQDGTPLAPTDSDSMSDFRYERDAAGARCPLGSHVRRANPREGGRHRLVRRGMSYGSELPLGVEDDVDRGLWFVAFNADIEDQFELVQKLWLNGPVGTLTDARDPIAGCGPRRAMVIEGDATANRAPALLLGLPRFVTCVGGQYYFYPGMSGIQELGSGPPTTVFPPAHSAEAV